MAETSGQPSPSDAEIQLAIADILKETDLTQLTSRIVRARIEEKFDICLLTRKKEIDRMLMAIISQNEERSTGNEEEQETENNEMNECEEQDSNGQDENGTSSEDDEPPPKKIKPKSIMESSILDDEALARLLHEAENGRSRRSTTIKQAERKKKVKKKVGGNSSSGYAKQLVLSPLLAEIVGQERMARSEVVRSLWKVIEERNLKDPKNKKYTICDKQLEQLFGKKRIQTFSMLKYLKLHMKNPGDLF
ncbi:uncharacterized protein [Montipora foliosa]|uniref:uncharacterized protein isoform X2 n=1 Tax=Montipora foliosa TaxID=591990 RepID=UPI0035F141BC